MILFGVDSRSGGARERCRPFAGRMLLTTIYLHAENSKSRKPESVPLEGELREIIEHCRAAAVWQSEDGQAHFSEYVFHNEGQPVGDFRKA